jgi:hypothetical protein
MTSNLLELLSGPGAGIQISPGETRRLLDMGRGYETMPIDNAPALVTYAINVSPNSIIRSDGDIKARVSWQTGRGSGQALIDVGRGTLVTLPSAWGATIDIVYGGTIGPVYQIDATATFGAMGNTRPIVSIPFVALGIGAMTARTPVPAYAATCRILTTIATGRGTGSMVAFYRDLASAQMYEFPCDSGTDEVIISGAEEFTIENRTPAIRDFIAVFGLNLG